LNQACKDAAEPGSPSSTSSGTLPLGREEVSEIRKVKAAVAHCGLLLVISARLAGMFQTPCSAADPPGPTPASSEGHETIPIDAWGRQVIAQNR